MAIEQIPPATDSPAPDILGAVVKLVNRYEQGGLSKTPDQLAANILLQRSLEEADL